MARNWQRAISVVFLAAGTFLWLPTVAVGQTWRGLTVAPESRCSTYESSDYSYPQSVELRIVESLGGVWSPYTGQFFSNRRQTDIEHIVARSEAHDSGLCAADGATRRRFARDPLNLTLASPRVNQQQKRAFDAAEWMPAINRCWFSDRIVRVRQKYNLTIDRREADALDAVLASCTSFTLGRDDGFATGGAPPTVTVALPEDVARWDDNQNGRITCAEARAHGIAPVRRGHPAYLHMNDRDNDGTVCE
jgi:hypothetical protein